MTTPTVATDVQTMPSGSQATDMLDLMLRLADLLAHETELLTAGRVRDIAALQIEKLRLTTLYDRAIKKFSTSGFKINALSPPLRAQIVAASTRLADAVKENESALRIGSAATRRVLDMVVESIRTRERTAARYTARRTSPRHGPVLAVAVDRRL
ncbi:MAG TPA: hypothetical protein VET85_07470 [Stellaceae bacterium]|nr:hypothetical protein [Stellaceae bacterium]